MRRACPHPRPLRCPDRLMGVIDVEVWGCGGMPQRSIPDGRRWAKWCRFWAIVWLLGCVFRRYQGISRRNTRDKPRQSKAVVAQGCPLGRFEGRFESNAADKWLVFFANGCCRPLEGLLDAVPGNGT